MGDPVQRVRQIVAVARPGLDLPEVVACAEAEINAACKSEWGVTRRWAIAQLHPLIPRPALMLLPAEREVKPCENLPPGAWLDLGATRIVRALYGNGAALVQAAAREITRRTDGSGKVASDVVIDELLNAGVKTTRKNILKWINSGDGKLWDKRGKWLFVYADMHHASGELHGRLNLVKQALESGRQELVESHIEVNGETITRVNLPGDCMLYVPYRASLKAWCGELVKAFHNTRRDPSANIQRTVLKQLFGVSKPTLLSWEKAAGGIRTKRTYAQCTDGHEHLTPDRAKRAIPYIPPKSTSSETAVTSRHWRFRWSNRYAVEVMRKREHRRAPCERRRAAKLVFQAMNAGKPITIVREAVAPAAVDGFLPSAKINFFNQQSSKRSVSAHEQIRSRVHKSEDYSHPYTADLGRNHRGDHIIEFTYGAYETRIHDQQPRRVSGRWVAANGGRDGQRLRVISGYQTLEVKAA
jgi:hypothetical protein